MRFPFFQNRVRSAALCLLAVSGLLCRADAKDAPTFARDVAPILYQNCSSCHHPDQVAPFSLLTYHDAQKRAAQIAAVTAKKVMPPWKAVHGYGEFANERRLTDAQIATLKAWAEAEAPEGDAKTAPPIPQYTDGWQLGKPDMIISMPKPYTIPAGGPDVNRSFVVPVHLPADRYVRAAEVRPGNRRIVHHCTVMYDKSGAARKLEAAQGGPGGGYVSFGGAGFVPAGALPGYAPGIAAEIMPLDAAAPLYKDVDVVFGMHYHPDGKIETDQTEIGLYFTDKKPTRSGSLLVLGVLNLDIAPGEKSHLETDEITLPVDVELDNVFEHMHLIGKTCKMWAELPDHTTVPLIKIDDWDFSWQTTYRLKKRLSLPKGTVIHGAWTHDNSADNFRNPNSPPKRVTNGENSTDEMAGALLNVYAKNEAETGILWLTMIGHLAKAQFTPAQHHAAPPTVSAAK